jgi:hypothetical protein
MDDQSNRIQRDESRKQHNAEFLARLYARRPQARAQYERAQQEAAQAQRAAVFEAAEPRAGRAPAIPAMTPVQAVLETIVREERPVLFVRDDWIDTEQVTAIGQEAADLIRDLNAKRETMKPLMPLIGRIDVTGFPGNDFFGTGWFVDTDIVVTNRHVAELIARWDGRKFGFVRGVAGKPITSSLSTLHEFDDLVVNETRIFAVEGVLYIESAGGPDIAFLRVRRRTDGSRPDHISVAKADVAADVPIFTVGYPARAPRSVIPDQELMRKLYRDRYDVKRAAPGFTMSPAEGATRHDCTTLGGASGSPVLNLATGEAVGLHFAGLYQETNYAVRASLLSDYITRKRWNTPPVIETQPPPAPSKPALQAPPQAAPPGSARDDTGRYSVSVTLPLTITISLGPPGDAASVTATLIAPGAGVGGAVAKDPAEVEKAAIAFWKARPDGVVAARVGFDDADDGIGDRPFIAASVPANRLSEVEAAGPATFQGCEVRYLPATVAEQIDAMPAVESVDRIAYDDDARTGAAFSFAPIEETMSVRAHVGPEYSWDVLHDFLDGANDALVSAMYEFHAPQIKDAIEGRLREGVSLTLVLDNSTFSKVKDPEGEFDRVPVFASWAEKFKTRFRRIVAPEGVSGLISDAYHIKVTVREDDTFWLSSGNWKEGSSQPVITQDMRDDATEHDLPGNREWHVVVKNTTLADRFRHHISQDFKRSEELGGGPSPKTKEAALDIFVDVPIEEAAVIEERRPPSRLLKPRLFEEKIWVKPLLTPDHQGAVYSEAVLDLIRSAKESLLFQIPYIGMASNPADDRGFIDELIDALVGKLKTLDDARVILRAGGSKFSAPTHAAWFFKSKGVDIAARLRQIQNHHTKGMIVDGQRVMIGSQNWSKPGVTLNRDASLIFDHAGLAGYFAEAFEIDWARANPIRPKKFVKKKKEDAVVREAVGAAPPPGFRRIRLADLLKEDDD